ncbi:hypothetical protein X975_15551, partial [Stegodyphus mimosarum]
MEDENSSKRRTCTSMLSTKVCPSRTQLKVRGGSPSRQEQTSWKRSPFLNSSSRGRG